MGYYTFYNLTVYSDDRELASKVQKALVEKELIDYVFEEDPCFNWDYQTKSEMFTFYPRDMAKWYDCEEDMLEISRQFPDVRFTIDGEGEESRDIWEEHFLNGKCQYCPADIVFPEFDPALLVERYYPEED